MTTQQARSAARKLPRVLVVDDEPALHETFRDTVKPLVACQLLTAGTVAEAERILSRHSVDALVTDIRLPDGSGISLLDSLRQRHPTAAAVVISGAGEQAVAIDALRRGAVDFIPKPFGAEDFARRLRQALDDRTRRVNEQNRHRTLRTAFKRLHAARRLISKRVDLLCNDLISAYGDLSRQMDSVRLQDGYRQHIASAGGLEQLLCHTMDWLLRQLGYCNIGVWLAADDQNLQLAAYMKYTLPAEPELVDAMEQNLLRMVMRRGFLRLRQPDTASQLTPKELKHLSSQELLAVNCTYLGESLGAMVLCRDHRTPFTDDDVAALKTIAPIFSLALAHAVRDEKPHTGGAAPTDGPKPPRKKDPADWWKNGEPPPF